MHIIHIQLYFAGTDPNPMVLGQSEQVIGERTPKIKKQCQQIIDEHAPKGVKCEIKIGRTIRSPEDDLIDACYKLKADVLCIGSKGIAHGFKEKISEKLYGVGHIVGHCMKNAPCDVMVFKEEHDNLVLNEDHVLKKYG